MRKAINVLVVEDSQDDFRLLLNELSRGGYDVAGMRVETAEDMNSALKMQKWDVVLSDYKLPGFSFVEALKLLKESGIDLPFIIVSAMISGEAELDAIQTGANDCIPKGNLSRLLPAVERELRASVIRRESRQATEALRKSEVRYRTLVEGAAAGVAMIDTRGTFVYVNRALCHTIGYSDSELLGKPFTDFLHPDDKRLLVRELQRASLRATPVEFRVIHKNGAIMCLCTSPGILRYDSRQIVGFSAIITDITGRKRAEERIAHLSGVLGAVRKVGQLIIREKTKESLIQNICDSLVERNSYENVCVVLLDETGKPESVAYAGLEVENTPVLSKMSAGVYPPCISELLAQKEPFVACYQPGKQHDGRIQADIHCRQGAYRCHLNYGGRLYGIMMVTVSMATVCDYEEQVLFLELCDNIAFALARIDRDMQPKDIEREFAQF